MRAVTIEVQQEVLAPAPCARRGHGARSPRAMAAGRWGRRSVGKLHPPIRRWGGGALRSGAEGRGAKAPGGVAHRETTARAGRRPPLPSPACGGTGPSSAMGGEGWGALTPGGSPGCGTCGRRGAGPRRSWPGWRCPCRRSPARCRGRGEVRTIGRPSVTLTPRSKSIGLERDQRLIVIHADRRVVGYPRTAQEQGVRRMRAVDRHAEAFSRSHRGGDDLDLLLPERAASPAWGLGAATDSRGLPDPEVPAQRPRRHHRGIGRSRRWSAPAPHRPSDRWTVTGTTLSSPASTASMIGAFLGARRSARNSCDPETGTRRVERRLSGLDWSPPGRPRRRPGPGPPPRSIEAITAGALAGSGVPITGGAGQRFRQDRDRLLEQRPGLCRPVDRADRDRPLEMPRQRRQPVGIVDQKERRDRRFVPAHPGLEGDLRPNPRRLAHGHGDGAGTMPPSAMASDPHVDEGGGVGGGGGASRRSRR